jgi:endogenous inhibitor of DNA gyrase (YacG/DUF329 family)
MIKVSCPVCGRVIEAEGPGELPAFPFCSARCRLIDLGRWLDERYGIEAEDQEARAPETDTP